MKTATRALAFASRWFDEATVHRVFDPLVADWQREWIEAQPARRPWILTRGSWWFAMTFLLMAPGTILRTPAPAGVMRHVTIRIAVFMAVTCGLMGTLVVMDARGATPARMAWLFVLLLPSFIAFAFPFATAFIVDIVRPRPETTFEQRVLMARVAIAAAVFGFAFGGWVVPPINQVFRVETRGYDMPAPAKSVRELTTAELILDPSLVAEHEPYTGGADRGARIRAEIQSRVYIIVLPLLLVWLRWRALELPRDGWRPLPASVASCLTIVFVTMVSFGGWRIEMGLGLPRGTGHWLSVAALMAWGLSTPYRRRLFFAGATAFQNSRIA